jgi:hypothetical protein
MINLFYIFISIVSIITPRFSLILICITTDWISKAYETAIWPFLGFLFMPYTTLVYMLAMINNEKQLSNGWIVFLVIAVILDFFKEDLSKNKTE